MFTSKWFFDLDGKLRAAGLDSDSSSFDEILYNLQNRRVLSPDDFWAVASYVILAGGFSQKTAKLKHAEIIKYIKKAGKNANLDDMLKIFNNRNKMAAVLKIWQNAQKYCDEYYSKPDTESKIAYLSTMPHIGKITANHFARNLGENVVKYDIWIQRLACRFAAQSANGKAQIVNLESSINNGNLHPDIKSAADDMFAYLEKVTGLPRGYIDVVLWKGAQNHMIQGL